jgi:hypothetical protein
MGLRWDNHDYTHMNRTIAELLFLRCLCEAGRSGAIMSARLSEELSSSFRSHLPSLVRLILYRIVHGA